MAEYLQLKSKLLRAGDPWQVDLSQFQVSLPVDEALYERDLLNFRRRFAYTEDAPEVAAQDTATITCASKTPRFNREHIGIRVGMGLFSRELENQLLGWRPGQTGTVTVKGEDVTVTVEAVRREVLPEVDDALAARCGIPYIRTAEDIRTYCRGHQHEDALEGPADDAFPYLMRQVIESSDFALDEEELAYSQDLSARQAHVAADQRPEDEAEEEQFGCSREEMEAMMRQAGAFILQCALLGLADLERGRKRPTETDYKDYLRRYMDVGNKTEEQARREHPVLEYLLNQVGGDYMDALEELTLQRLKENLQ